MRISRRTVVNHAQSTLHVAVHDCASLNVVDEPARPTDVRLRL